MSSLSNSQHHGSSDPPVGESCRPERSRNAKAQARHRAKRKAYVDQLEQTVTKLQSMLAISSDRLAAVPPPLVRIRELEQENEALYHEVQELRRQLGMRRDSAQHGEHSMSNTREANQHSAPNASGLYVTHGPPPPLIIPSASDQYPQSSPGTSTHGHTYKARQGSSSFYQSYDVSVYHVAETPVSSTISSPSFAPSNSDVSSSLPSPYAHHHIPSSYYSQPSPALPNLAACHVRQYELVKTEGKEQYRHSHTDRQHTTFHTGHYP